MKTGKLTCIFAILIIALCVMSATAYADDGDITSWAQLQAAIDAAATGETITLTEDLTATSEDTMLSFPSGRTITLDLNGHTLRRNGRGYVSTSRVIYVPEGAQIELLNGVLTEGISDSGGAIYNEGVATLIDVDMTENAATANEGDYHGGTIYNNGTLFMTGGSISRSFSNDAGAIFNYESGHAYLTEVVLEQNESKNHGGGAIVNYNDLTLTDCRIVNNHAKSNGGGIWSNKPFEITGGEIADNTSQANGGGIYLTETATLTASGVEILRNKAVEGGGIGTSRYFIELGFSYLTSCSEVTLTDVDISGNEASAQGGGISNRGKLTMERCTVTQNTAAGDGGGIFNALELTMAESTVDGNISESCGGGICNSNVQKETDVRMSDSVISNNVSIDGGGIFIDDPYYEDEEDDGTFVKVFITGDTAITGNEATARGGGGIRNGGELTLSGSITITDNTSKGNGGGLWTSQTMTANGTIVIRDNASNSGTPNLYLMKDCVLHVMGGLEDESEIHVSVADTPCEVASSRDGRINANADIFQSDMAGCRCMFKNDRVYIGEDVFYTARSWNGKNVVSESTAMGPYLFLSDIDAASSTERILLTDPVGNDAWYYVDRDLTFDKRMVVDCTVNIVLADGVTLTCNKGINVPSGKTLNIYGQTNDTGKLIADAQDWSAGIGGDDEEACGTINIFGGDIKATSKGAAGIGGGDEAACWNISIYGGKVEASGGGNKLGGGAGIGCGADADTPAGTISIYGGEIKAHGCYGGSGIGSGDDPESHDNKPKIDIYGGDIDAWGFRGDTPTDYDDGAGIGGGNAAGPGKVTIRGGRIYAKGAINAAGIGGGDDGDMEDPQYDEIIIEGGTITACGGNGAPGIGPGMGSENIQLHIVDCDKLTAEGGKFYAAGIGSGNADNLAGSITIDGGTIYANVFNDPESREYHCGAAGIGAGASDGFTGGSFEGELTINGGTIYAAGSYREKDSKLIGGGAGIGGGYGGNMNGTITINGGYVEATTRGGGAGIGAGSDSDFYLYGNCNGTVSVYGGTVVIEKEENDDAKPIGRGRDGWVSGTLNLGPGMCVFSGGDLPTYVRARVSQCQTSWNGKIRIEPCVHPDHGYEVTNMHHAPTCKYCESSFEPELHSFDDSSTCTVCGYKNKACTVTFKANGGTGKMETVSLVPGSTYTLPECDFIAPKRSKFDSWSVESHAQESQVVMQPGGEITIKADTTVTANWRAVPAFMKNSLLLSGEIGINFFMDLPKLNGVNYEDSYMEFTVNGKGKFTKTVPFDPNRKNSTGEYYGFTCYVNSIQMANTIKAVFHYGDGETVETTYSVKQYVLDFDEVAADYDETTVALVHALADFGHYAQAYLSEANGWSIGSDYGDMDTYYTTYDADEIARIKAQAADHAASSSRGEDIQSVGFSLVLDSETAIKASFKPVEGYTGKFTVSVKDQDGSVVDSTLKKSGGRYRVNFAGIAAHKLGDAYTISAQTANGETEVVVSAISYACLLMENKTDANSLNAAAAIYRYWDSAKAFQAAH